MMPSVFRVAHIVARIDHRCCECGGTIKPLDVYERTVGCWDGDWSTYKVCLGCEEARDFYVEHFADGRDPDDGQFCFTSLFADFMDVVWELPDNGTRFEGLRHLAKMRIRNRQARKAVAANDNQGGAA